MDADRRSKLLEDVGKLVRTKRHLEAEVSLKNIEVDQLDADLKSMSLRLERITDELADAEKHYAATVIKTPHAELAVTYRLAPRLPGASWLLSRVIASVRITSDNGSIIWGRPERGGVANAHWYADQPLFNGSEQNTVSGGIHTAQDDEPEDTLDQSLQALNTRFDNQAANSE